MMPAPQRTIGAPAVNPETKPFWDAAQAGRFVIGSCRACGQVHWYPRAVCPCCLSPETELKDASGTGTIYSYTVMRRAPEPYALAYVTLAEGPTLLTNIVDADLDALRIGQAVSVVFRASESGQDVPMFTPAQPSGQRS